MPLLMQTLKQVELFQGLSSPQLERLSALCHSHIWARRDTIFKQGDAADTLYVIASGQVEIAVHNTQGDLQPEIYLGAGQIIGEMGLVDAGTRSGGGEQKRTSAKRPLVVSSAQPLAKRRRRASTGGVLAQDPAGENKYTK